MRSLSFLSSMIQKGSELGLLYIPARRLDLIFLVDRIPSLCHRRCCAHFSGALVPWNGTFTNSEIAVTFASRLVKRQSGLYITKESHEI